MNQHRDVNIQARKNDIKKSRSSKRVPYVGPDEGECLDLFRLVMG